VPLSRYFARSVVCPVRFRDVSFGGFVGTAIHRGSYQTPHIRLEQRTWHDVSPLARRCRLMAGAPRVLTVNRKPVTSRETANIEPDDPPSDEPAACLPNPL
jgi:hypothetical protein